MISNIACDWQTVSDSQWEAMFDLVSDNMDFEIHIT